MLYSPPDTLPVSRSFTIFIAGVIAAAVLLGGCTDYSPSDPVTAIHDQPAIDFQKPRIPTPQRLYAKQGDSLIVINTATGRGTTVGPLGHEYTKAGFATARSAVSIPSGTLPAKTLVGVLKEKSSGDDFVVAIDTKTGEAHKIVKIKDDQLEHSIHSRGAAFGPDGSTLYAYDDHAWLFRIDTETGAATAMSSNEFWGSLSLEFDPASEEFLAVQRRTGKLLQIDPSNASLTIRGTFTGPLSGGACTLARSVRNDWFTQKNSILHTVDVINVTASPVPGSQGVGTCGSEFAPERPLKIPGGSHGGGDEPGSVRPSGSR